MRLPPLNALRVFYVLGQTTSHRRAADMLCVTHTAVVRQIKELEAWFGVKLVSATVRGTELTSEGRRLYTFVAQGFELFAQGTQEIKPSRHAQELRIWASPGFATFWILPRLGALQEALPGVAISILPTEQTPSFLDNEVDVVIRYGTPTGRDLSSHQVLRPRLIALASETWIARHPEVRIAKDLMSVPLIHERFQDDWQRWFEAVGIKHCGPLNGPRVGVLPAVLEAVLQDQGPGLFPEVFNVQNMRGGLKQVVPDTPRIGGYYFVTRSDRENEPRIVQFREWLNETLKDC